MIFNDIDSLVCPACKDPLNKNEDILSCLRCNAEYNVKKEIPNFLEKEIYWSEPGMTEDIMKGIVSDLSDNYWYDLLSNHESESVRNHCFFISDLSRAKWHKILNLDSNSTILDLGAGTGTISHALSKHYKKIYSVEPVELRCEFMKHRFKQEKINNVTVIRADSKSLPFENNFFDHIIMNGVLEWIPYSYKNLNPRKSQILVLKKLHKLLKPNGSISIGIENRATYAYFLGAPDCHLGIKYVTILPRLLAHLVCKLKINDIYRPYLYTHIGLKKLLSKAGYSNIDIYNSLPDYNKPKYTIKIDSKSEKFYDYIWPTRNPIALKIKKIMSDLDILKYFCYAYRAVGKKP